jgi:DNA-binding MarR family transcriptional regulator
MDTSPDLDRDLLILEQITKDPDATQASLATQMGVAVGTINWHIKRLVAKGYVKVRRAERRKLRYIITPEGIALRARKTFDYIQQSFALYRLTRGRVADAVERVREAGYAQVSLRGDGDVADVCRLTCLEQGMIVVEDDHVPTLVIQDLKVLVEWPSESEL